MALGSISPPSTFDGFEDLLTLLTLSAGRLVLEEVLVSLWGVLKTLLVRFICEE